MTAKLRPKVRTTCRAISDTTILQRDADGNETVIATIPRRKSHAAQKAATRNFVSADKTPELTPERELILADLAKYRNKATDMDEMRRRNGLL